MRKVVVAEYVSLAGIGEDPGRIGAFERRRRALLLLDTDGSTHDDPVDAGFPIDSLAYSGCVPPPEA